MTRTMTATDIEPETVKRPRGRPVENVLPEPIPDTPENIAKAIMQGRLKEMAVSRRGRKRDLRLILSTYAKTLIQGRG